MLNTYVLTVDEISGVWTFPQLVCHGKKKDRIESKSCESCAFLYISLAHPVVFQTCQTRVKD